MPKTQMRLPEGSILAIGTIACDDKIHQDVYVSYTRAGEAKPCLELSLPPKSIDVIIHYLQKRANDARFVNGEEMLEYPEPVPAEPLRKKLKQPRGKGSQKAAKPPDGQP